MGRLDHVHVRVPNRAEAAGWYAEHLGFEPVERFDFWAKGFPGGPLQISADGGQTTLALFEASEGHPKVANTTGIAFSVEVDVYKKFTRSLPGEIRTLSGEPLMPNDMIDFDIWPPAPTWSRAWRAGTPIRSQSRARGQTRSPARRSP